MSLLQNPDFESDLPDPWKRENSATDVNLLPPVFDPDGARTGSRYLKFLTHAPHGSVAQNIKVTMPSVTALAYVRAERGEMTGSLIISEAGGNQISAPFKVGETWTQVIAVLGMKNAGANRSVRVEFKLTTIDAFLHIDSVSAF